MRYIQIPVEDYLEMLEQRFEVCKQRGWVGDAQESLFPQVLDLIEEVGVSPENSSPSYIIDNYCVNGEFISREDFEENPDWYPSYDDWSDVQDNALVSNEEYACMQF